MKLCTELFNLAGQIAVVVGDGAAALRFAQTLAGAGARVIRITPTTLDASGDPSAKIEMLVADPANRSEILRATETIVESHGRIDILVNARHRFSSASAVTIAPQDWLESVRIHIHGLFVTCQAVGLQMLKQGHGSIVNLSSIAGSLGVEGTVTFGSAMGAVDQLTRTLGVEWVRRGVRVNAIATWDDAFHDPAGPMPPKVRKRLTNETLPPNDALDGALLYFTSAASTSVSGQILTVDQGFSAQ